MIQKNHFKQKLLLWPQAPFKADHFFFFFGVVTKNRYDLVQFVQFKKREKHPWRHDTFSKVAGTKTVGTFTNQCS